MRKSSRTVNRTLVVGVEVGELIFGFPFRIGTYDKIVLHSITFSSD